MRWFISARTLRSVFVAQKLVTAVLTLSTVACPVKANMDHAWHRARMAPVHGKEDLPAWVVSLVIAVREVHGAETLRSIAVLPQDAMLAVSTTHT